MTTRKKAPKAASAELAPEELDRVIGGGSTGKAGSQTLSKQEEGAKLADGPATLTRSEEWVKKSGG